MHWAPLSRQWKDEARWMTKRENGHLGWALLGRQGGKEGEQCGGEGGVSQTNLFNEKCEERGAWVAFAWDIRKKCMHTQRILSLMISLLACTQTYKNNTALISTWHDVIITVLQMFKNKRIQTNTRKNSKIRHDDGTSASHMKNQPFPPAWNEARPETQVGPKKSALFHSFFSFFFLLFFFPFCFFIEKKSSQCVHQSGSRLLTS